MIKALITNGGTFTNHFGFQRSFFIGPESWESRMFQPIDVWIFNSIEDFFNNSEELLKSFDQISILERNGRFGETHPHGFENAWNIAEEVRIKLGIKRESYKVRIYFSPKISNERDSVKRFAFI